MKYIGLSYISKVCSVEYYHVLGSLKVWHDVCLVLSPATKNTFSITKSRVGKTHCFKNNNSVHLAKSYQNLFFFPQTSFYLARFGKDITAVFDRTHSHLYYCR